MRHFKLRMFKTELLVSPPNSLPPWLLLHLYIRTWLRTSLPAWLSVPLKASCGGLQVPGKPLHLLPRERGAARKLGGSRNGCRAGFLHVPSARRPWGSVSLQGPERVDPVQQSGGRAPGQGQRLLGSMSSPLIASMCPRTSYPTCFGLRLLLCKR